MDRPITAQRRARRRGNDLRTMAWQPLFYLRQLRSNQKGLCEGVLPLIVGKERQDGTPVAND